MSNCQPLFYRVKLLIWAVWTATLTRIVWFWSRIESKGIGVTVVPGFLVWNIGLRAGESG